MKCSPLVLGDLKKFTAISFLVGVLGVISYVRAGTISQSVAMPVANQSVTLAVSEDLLGNPIAVAGPLGASQLITDAQGQAAWTPTRYGKYTLTCGTVTNTVWVTAKPLIIHWWNGNAAPRYATVVMAGDKPYWQSRGVKYVNWVGGESYSRGADGHYFTTAQEWLNNWSYAKTSDGIALDEINGEGGAPTDAIVQAVEMIPQQWGPSYSLGVYFAGIGNGFDANAAKLKAVNAYCLIEDYWGDYNLHVSRWGNVKRYGLQDRSVLTLSPNFYISESQRGPRNVAEVREQFRQVRLAAPEAPGIGFFNAYGAGLDGACDQAIEDYFLKPVINMSINGSGQAVAWNIGNEMATGFSLQVLNLSGTVLQTYDLSTLAPNGQLTLSLPADAMAVKVINPSDTINLYPNGLFSIPGRYVFTHANGDHLWSTFSNWSPSGPPPGNIDSGNHACFGNGGTNVTAIAGETSITSVQITNAGWTIAGNATSQDFFTYWISSAGTGTNTINIGYRTTAGVPAVFKVESNNTLAMNGQVSGAGGLLKQGNGTLRLSYANNSYPGATTISAGTLQIAGAGALGGGSYAGAITNSGTLEFSSSANQTLSGPMSGAGNLTLSGAGTVFLSGTNSLTGMVNLGAGTLKLNGGANTIANATLAVTGGALNYNGATAVRFGALAGTQGLSIAGLSGSSGSDAGFIIGGNNTSTTYAGALSGAGGVLTKVGNGTQVLDGASTYTGNTFIQGGGLLINGSLGNTAVTVSPPGTLGGVGSIGGAVSVQGTLAAGNGGVGNLTVNNALTLAAGSAVVWEISDWISDSGHDKVIVASLDLTATAANPVIVRPKDLSLAHFAESNASFVIVETTSGITGFSADKFTVDTSGLTLPNGTWTVQQSGNNLVLAYTAGNPDGNGNGILDTWEVEHFGNAALAANGAIADPDHDGISNLLEFAFGTHPLEANASPLVYDLESLADGAHLRLILQKNPTAGNLIYTVESCGALDDWSTLNTTVESNTSNQLIVRDNLINEPRRFMRVRIQVAP